MDVKKNSLLALALGGALCCGALQAEVSQALPERGESPRAICESPRSADGDASWDGSSSKEANHADEELASIFSQHRDVWGGVEFCRDYSGLRVYVKNSSSISLADPVKQKHPTIPIYFVEVPFSSLDLEAAQDEVMRKDLSPTLSTEPDPERGRVLVETGAPTGDLKQVRIPSDRAVGSHAVVPVVYVGNNIESGYASTRGNDASPFTSGADIRAQGFMCSLGPRVYYNGRYVMLTAGHCLGGTHYTPQGKVWAISIPRPTQEMPVYMVIGRCYRGNRILPTSIILDHRPHLDTTGLGRTSVLCRVATSYVLLGGRQARFAGL